MLSLRDVIGNVKKHQSALNVRMILNGLEQAYIKSRGDIVIIGCDKDGTSGTTVYMTMPSGRNPSKKYTIAIYVKTQTKMTLDTDIKVYANVPAFLYNFTYVFHKKGSLLFPEKYPEEFRTTPPKIRNPFGTVGFSKHVFAAIRYISDYKLPRIISEYSGRPVISVPTIRVSVNRSTGKTELVL